MLRQDAHITQKHLESDFVMRHMKNRTLTHIITFLGLYYLSCFCVILWMHIYPQIHREPVDTAFMGLHVPHLVALLFFVHDDRPSYFISFQGTALVSVLVDFSFVCHFAHITLNCSSFALCFENNLLFGAYSSLISVNFLVVDFVLMVLTWISFIRSGSQRSKECFVRRKISNLMVEHDYQDIILVSPKIN